MTITTKHITMLTVALALFMDVMDSNIINTAIPAMSKSLQVHPIDLKIALISYMLSLAIFIPISGWTADKYGIKKIFITAIGLFTLSSFWCGYVHTLLELVIARSIQGVGGAFMISLGRLIIARTFQRHQLIEAMNAVVIVISMAVMLGPVVGGFITDHFSWPWIFWINIPAGLLTMALAGYGLKDTAPRKSRPFDRLGFLLFGGSLALLCFALSDLSESGIKPLSILCMISIAIGMFIGYIFHANRSQHPVINIKLLRIPTFSVSVFGNLCSRLGFGGIPFLLPLLQQLGLGFSAQLSGLLLMPMAFGVIFSKLIALKILRITGYKRYLFVNTFLVGLILWLFPIVNTGTSPYTIASLTFIFGIVLSAQFTAVNSLAFADINEQDYSASTSITSTVQVIAQSLGVAVSAILLKFFAFKANLTTTLTPEVFHQTFYALGIITFMSMIIFTRLRINDGTLLLTTKTN